MKITQIVDKVSEILDMSVHHFDHREFKKNYLPYIETAPVVVAYSQQYSPWCFAILDDMSVVTPGFKLMKQMEGMLEIMKDFVDDDEEPITFKLEKSLNMLNTLKVAENYIKDNNLNLKNFNKDILTYYF